MFSFTEKDLNDFYTQVVEIVANKLGITDNQYKSSKELVIEIEHSDDNVYKNLIAFIEAYDEWYQGVVKNNQTNQKTILDLIHHRDSARRTLLKSLPSNPRHG